MIVVVNKYKHSALPGWVDCYIGRGNPLGNPWTHVPHRQTLAKYVVATREEAIEKYKFWINVRLADTSSEQYQAFRRIVKLARDYNINLVCFCKPQPCHGDYIKQLIENLLGE